MFGRLLCIVAAAGAVPSWPPLTRFILNPTRGSSIPTANCRAQFNTPCAIEKIHQIVYELAASFEAAATTTEFDQLVAAVNAKEHNQPVLFWPTVLNSTGYVLATGAPEPGATYTGPPYVDAFYPDILVAEGRHNADKPTLGGVAQNAVWADIQAAAARTSPQPPRARRSEPPAAAPRDTPLDRTHLLVPLRPRACRRRLTRTAT